MVGVCTVRVDRGFANIQSVPNVRDFKIQDPVPYPQKKISVPFCPNISGQNGSVLGSSGNFKSDKTERIFG